MSIIEKICTCNFCENKIKYYWILSDAKFEQIPNKEEYVCAEHMKYGDTYVDSMRCPYCKRITENQYAIDE